MKEKFTNIRIKVSTLKLIHSLKKHPRETNYEALERLINAPNGEKGGDCSQE